MLQEKFMDIIQKSQKKIKTLFIELTIKKFL